MSQGEPQHQGSPSSRSERKSGHSGESVRRDRQSPPPIHLLERSLQKATKEWVSEQDTSHTTLGTEALDTTGLSQYESADDTLNSPRLPQVELRPPDDQQNTCSSRPTLSPVVDESPFVYDERTDVGSSPSSQERQDDELNESRLSDEENDAIVGSRPSPRGQSPLDTRCGSSTGSEEDIRVRPFAPAYGTPPVRHVPNVDHQPRTLTDIDEKTDRLDVSNDSLSDPLMAPAMLTDPDGDSLLDVLLSDGDDYNDEVMDTVGPSQLITEVDTSVVADPPDEDLSRSDEELDDPLPTDTPSPVVPPPLRRSKRNQGARADYYKLHHGLPQDEPKK